MNEVNAPTGEERGQLNDKIDHEELQEQVSGPEVSDWEPSAPPGDGSPPDYYTAIRTDMYPADVPPPPEYIPPPVQGLETGKCPEIDVVQNTKLLLIKPISLTVNTYWSFFSKFIASCQAVSN